MADELPPPEVPDAPNDELTPDPSRAVPIERTAEQRERTRRALLRILEARYADPDPEPVDYSRFLPTKWRKVVYAIAGAAISVEGALDMSGYGLVPARPQGAVMAVLAALGFKLAHSNAR